MQRKMFSIIIPTLNEEKYLPHILKDLASQNFKDFEVIIVDASSSDNTVKVASDYSQKIPLSIHLVDREKANVCLQRNVGAEKASGKYLVFFDADVQISKTFLYRLSKELNKNPYFFLTTYLLPDSRNMMDKTIAQFYNMLMEVSIKIDHPLTPGFNTIVQKDIFINIGGFRTNIKHAEDYDLAVRFWKLGCQLKILKNPKLVFSLRRYRAEGRINVFRKRMQATIYLLRKGEITKDLFSYPMGGDWYKIARINSLNARAASIMRKTVRRFRHRLSI